MCMQAARAGVWRVSSHGRVCNTRGQISHGSQRASGYLEVLIARKHHLVHRLVAFAHLRLPPSTMHDIVIHAEGDPANNHVSNLVYGTRKECGALAARSQTGRGHPNACKPVLSRAPGEWTWTMHRSVTAAAAARGVTPAAAQTCCSRCLPTRSGIEFKHAQHENLAGEQWKPAVHPSTGTLLRGALISSMGRVLNSKGICNWGSVTSAGYRAVHIHGGTHLVHRLVLSSFAESLPSYSWVANHIDGDKQNNTLENLEFATAAQNAEHAVRSNLCKPVGPCRAVLGRTLGSQEWTRFPSRTAAAIHVCCSSTTSISLVCSGRKTSVKGWEFRNACDDTTLPGERWAPVVTELPS